MKYNGLVYMIGEGFRNLFKNKKSTMISLITMICAMFLFGAFFSIGENVNHVLKQIEKNQGIEIFLKKGVTEKEIAQLKEKILELDGINTIEFKSEQDAMDILKEQFGDNKDLLKDYEGENNPLSASFVVKLTDLQLSEEIETKIEKFDNVKNITSRNDTINTLIKITNGIKLTIGVIFIILLVIAVTIISNTIRLTVYARRKEISIMKYIGATNNFIRWPFVIEGIIIGILAAIITLVVVGNVYGFVVQKLEESAVLQIMNIELYQFTDLLQNIVIVYIVLGVGIGIIGSSISMKKYLEV